MSDSDQILFEHVVSTLPDALPKRKKILLALVHKLTDRHPAIANLRGQLAAIEAIETLQTELPLRFSK